MNNRISRAWTSWIHPSCAIGLQVYHVPQLGHRVGILPLNPIVNTNKRAVINIRPGVTTIPYGTQLVFKAMPILTHG